MSYTGVITETVEANMRRLGFSQTSLAEALGMSQAAVSKKMNGLSRWSTDDIDVLTALGFEIPAPGVEADAS